MLVLSRKLSERIVVITPDGEQIKIAPVRIKSGSVRLGIDAPAEYRIVRDEVLERDLKPETVT